MKARIKRYVLTALVMALFGFLAWLIGIVAPESVPPRYITRLRIALMGIGLLAAGLVFRFLTKRWKGRIRGEKAAARQDKLKSLFRAAHKRLAASPKAEEKSLRKLPTLIVLGPSGATKTTVVENSGLNTELLEGEIYRGEAVAPTELANLWYAEGSIVLEAGGALLDEPEKWEALLSYTQPARLAAALGFGQQAPRTALVCVGCDEFTQPGATEHVTTLARKLRDRLVEAAEALGIRLPVYVLFTRADRLPYYDDFVRAVSGDEAARALGATLPLQAEASASAHAGAEGARVTRYLDEVLHALRLKRREFLMRERDAEVQAGVYEFPRELEKIRGHIHRFLVELCRPSQLGRSPFLRGFHFTGVRALVVDEPGTAAPSASLAAPTDSASLGATQVFDQARIQAAAAAARQAAAGRSRRVPDWAFLKPFFQKVLLPDEAARTMTTGGARVDVLRRGLLGALTLAGLVWVVGLAFSYRANHATLDRIEAVARQVDAESSPAGGFPSVETLRQLDTLRAELARLRFFEIEGRPLGMRWGLYHGNDALRQALPVYLAGFDAAIGREARARLRGNLQDWTQPDSAAGGAPASYGATYEALKAYLILTDHPSRSQVGFLPPAVVGNWPRAMEAQADEGEPERFELLDRQLTFFAEVIAGADSLGIEELAPPDSDVVDTARRYLVELSGVEQAYQSVLNAAGQYGEEFRLSMAVPNSRGVLDNDIVVEPWFTAGAYRWVDTVAVDAMFSEDDWVLGEYELRERPSDVGEAVKAMYRTAYAERWLEFLRGTDFAAFGGAAQAAGRLEALGASNSPLLAMLERVAYNTRPLAEEFEPVQWLYPATEAEGADEAGEEDEEDRPLVWENTTPYADALLDLQQRLEAVANDPQDERAAESVRTGVSDGNRRVEEILRNFDFENPSYAALERILRTPLDRAGSVAAAAGVAGTNSAGSSFCTDFGQRLVGFPFQSGGREADVDAVVEALAPSESLLSAFITELEDAGLIERLRGSYRKTEPRVRDRFMTFLNAAVGVSNGLFSPRGELSVSFRLAPQNFQELGADSIRVEIGSVPQVTTPYFDNLEEWVWVGDDQQHASIYGFTGGNRFDILSRRGPWAVFELFGDATWSEYTGGGCVGQCYTLRWNDTAAGPLVARLEMEDGSLPVFRSDILSGLACESRIVQ